MSAAPYVRDRAPHPVRRGDPERKGGEIRARREGNPRHREGKADPLRPGDQDLPRGRQASWPCLLDRQRDRIRRNRMSLKERIELFKASRYRSCTLGWAARAKELPAIRSLGADLMAVSPGLPDNALTMAEKHAIPNDILTDTTSQGLKKNRL